MNKGRREEIAQLKKKKRIKQQFSPLILDGRHLNVYKTTGKPCSCYLCSGEKYNRKRKHKNKDE